jgi:hypothetical protein
MDDELDFGRPWGSGVFEDACNESDKRDDIPAISR